MPKLKGAALPAIALVLAGCTAKPTTILSEPEGAYIKVDGANKGSAPVEHTFRFGQKQTHVVQATLASYLPAEVLVTREDLNRARGMLKIPLERDTAWAETTTSQATNRWLRVQVNSAYTLEDMWRRVVDIVSSRYSIIEQLDADSGYIRSATETRRFQRAGEQFLVRTQVVGTISSSDPLVYRIKIISESSDGLGAWVPYDRIFKDDAQLIEEFQNRLTIH